MQYVVILATDPSSLSATVNARLRDGWQIQGSVVLAYDSKDQEQWAQAMIKADETDGSRVTQSDSLPAATVSETPRQSRHAVNIPLSVTQSRAA
jgi:hypothetical protein